MLAARKCTEWTSSAFDHRGVVTPAARRPLLGVLAASLLFIGSASAQSGGKLSKVGPWALAEESDSCRMFMLYNAGSLWVTYDATDDVYLYITTDKIKLKEGKYLYNLIFTDRNGKPKGIYDDAPLYVDPPNKDERTFLKGLFGADVLDAIKDSDSLAMLKGENIVEVFNLPNASAAIGKFKNCVEKVRKTQGFLRK